MDFYYGILRYEMNVDLLNSCVDVGIVRALGLVNYPGDESILEVNSSRLFVPAPSLFVKLLHSLPHSMPMNRDEFAINAREVLRDECGISDL